MANVPPDVKARTLLEQIDHSTPRASPITITGVIGLIGLIVLGFAGISQPFAASSGQAGTLFPARMMPPRLLVVSVGSAISPTYVSVQPDASGRDDLIFISIGSTIVSRTLTLTPDITETWPVLDKQGQRIAYYGLRDNGGDVYVQALADGVPFPITLQAGKSGLHVDYKIVPSVAPAFSPDGSWIAFSVQSTKQAYIELCIARTDGKQVLDIRRLNSTVTDYVWIDSSKLVLLTQSPDGSLNKWIANIEPPIIRFESLP